MANITISIPDASLARVVDAMATTHGWTAADGPKAAFAKKQLIDYIVGNVRAAEKQTEDAARVSTVTDIDGIT